MECMEELKFGLTAKDNHQVGGCLFFMLYIIWHLDFNKNVHKIYKMSPVNKKHTCHALIVHCIDFRFQGAIRKLFNSLGLRHGHFDRLSVAGGAGNFKILEEHAPLSRKLHEPELVILTIHEDCGAGAKKEDLRKARKIAKKSIPNTRCFYLKLNGEVEEVR